MDNKKNFTNNSTLAEIFESAGYKINSADIAVGAVLDLLENPNLTREEAFEIIDALGNMVGEINALVNGYFDDHGENYYFRDFIR
jgi:hypothetical protein